PSSMAALPAASSASCTTRALSLGPRYRNAQNGTARCADRLKPRDSRQAVSFGRRPMSFGVGGGLHPRKAAERTERADDTDPHSQLLHIAGWLRDRRGP